PAPAALGSLPTNNSVPALAAATPQSGSANSFTHTIASGESLYTIARRYDVTTQSLVPANNLSSPDKIVVGQKVIIPGRADLLATKAPTQVASTAPMLAPAPAQQTLPQAAANPLQAAAPAPAQAAPAQAAPTQTAAIPAAEPA